MDEKWLAIKIGQACEAYVEGELTTARFDAVVDAYAYPIAQAHKEELRQLFKYAGHLPSCTTMGPDLKVQIVDCDCGYVAWYKRLEE